MPAGIGCFDGLDRFNASSALVHELFEIIIGSFIGERQGSVRRTSHQCASREGKYVECFLDGPVGVICF